MLGAFGRQVIDLDLSHTLAADVIESIKMALTEHQVLLFCGQSLSDERMREIGNCIGEVRALPGGFRGRETVFGVRHLTNLGEDGKPTGRHPDHFSKNWHTDGATLTPPAKATLLYALQSPESGGATEFASMIAGLKAFSSAERCELSKLDAIHDVDLARVFRHGRRVIQQDNVSFVRRMQLWYRFFRRMLPGQATVHPVLRRCEQTGRTAIMLGSDVWRIRGLGWRRGMRDVNKLIERALRGGSVLSYCLQPDDLVIWDNRSLLHRVTDYDTESHSRVMRQVVVLEREMPAE